jgi:hypothetical protein
MILEGGGVFDRVSASSDATLKLLIRDVMVFIGGGESTEVTVGLDIVSTRIGVTVISGDFSTLELIKLSIIVINSTFSSGSVDDKNVFTFFLSFYSCAE